MSAVDIVNPAGRSPVVLLCEHASRRIPEPYAGLGLDEPDLSRHIAWDIGADPLARGLSKRLDAALFVHGYSRLLIDPNRPLGAPDSIPASSEDTPIPGNQILSEAERRERTAAFFTPYHDAVAAHLDGRVAAGRSTVVVGVHTFTPVFRGHVRPWQVGILYGQAQSFGRDLIRELARDASLQVGDNEPYRIHVDEDYTVPIHGDARGIPAVLVEVRNDLLRTRDEIGGWIVRLADVLTELTAGGGT